MDFDRITSSVSQYVDKQKSSMLENPRNINMALRKLNLYVESFHNDIQERFEAENRTVPAGVADRVKKPVIEFDTDRLENADRIKGKVISLSNQLLNELGKSRNLLESTFNCAQEDVDRFRYKVRDILYKFNEVPQQNTLLEKVLHAIRGELAQRWNYGKTLNTLQRYMEMIQDGKVIEELRKKAVDHLEVADNIIDRYNTYFAACIWQYQTCYSGAEQSASVEESEQPEEPMREGSDMDRFLAENERGLMERMTRQAEDSAEALPRASSVQENPAAGELSSVTMTFKGKEPKTIELSSLAESLRSELADVLLKISEMTESGGG